MHFTPAELIRERLSLRHELTAADRAIAAWVKSATQKNGVPYDRVYDADVWYGHALAGLDGYRVHLDWYANTLPFPPLPERYNEGLNQLMGLLDECRHSLIDVEHEMAAIESTILAHTQPPSERLAGSRFSQLRRVFSHFGQPPRYRFPFMPVEFRLNRGEKPPKILVNVHFLRAALAGFSGRVTFWYHRHEPASNPVAFGTPGQRLAIIMPAV